MQSLFQQKPYENILLRIEKLTPESQPLWGKMDVAQMLTHCQGPLKVPLGELQLKNPGFLVKLLFKFKPFKKTIYNDALWKKGIPTAKEFKVIGLREFETEKKELIKWIDAFYAEREKTDWKPHPIFGYLTAEQWGKTQYKHLDHHLTQFGV